MKFVLGRSTGSTSSIVGTTPLTINMRRVQLFGAAVGLLLLALMIALLGATFSYGELFGVYEKPVWSLLAVFALLIPAHEFFHLIAYPRLGFDGHAVIGYDPKSGLPYTAYLEILSKHRYTVAALMPFVGLSVLLVLCATIFVNYRSEFLFAMLGNALGSGGDLYIVAQIVANVPKGYVIEGGQFGRRS